MKFILSSFYPMQTSVMFYRASRKRFNFCLHFFPPSSVFQNVMFVCDSYKLLVAFFYIFIRGITYSAGSFKILFYSFSSTHYIYNISEVYTVGRTAAVLHDSAHCSQRMVEKTTGRWYDADNKEVMREHERFKVFPSKSTVILTRAVYIYIYFVFTVHLSFIYCAGQCA